MSVRPKIRRATLFMVSGSLSKPPCEIALLRLSGGAPTGVGDQITSARPGMPGLQAEGCNQFGVVTDGLLETEDRCFVLGLENPTHQVQQRPSVELEAVVVLLGLHIHRVEGHPVDVGADQRQQLGPESVHPQRRRQQLQGIEPRRALTAGRRDEMRLEDGARGMAGRVHRDPCRGSPRRTAASRAPT